MQDGPTPREYEIAVSTAVEFLELDSQEELPEQFHAALRSDSQLAKSYINLAAAHHHVVEADSIQRDIEDTNAYPPQKVIDVLGNNTNQKLGEIIEDRGIKLLQFQGTVVRVDSNPEETLLLIDDGYIQQQYTGQIDGHSPKLGEEVTVEITQSADPTVMHVVKN